MAHECSIRRLDRPCGVTDAGRLAEFGHHRIELGSLHRRRDQGGDDLHHVLAALHHVDATDRVMGRFQSVHEEIAGGAGPFGRNRDLNLVGGFGLALVDGTRLIAFTRGRSSVFPASTATVTRAASMARSAPAKAPTAAEHHRVAAVLRPCTFMPSFMITPAPRKPMPEIT